tara:strand:+ start:313 stop:549 length:237 start_codon:yes stop_codon:yes gene_type:complete
MKLLSFSIILGSLLISFHYFWVNRIEIKRANDMSLVIFNKWTGDHCVFYQAESSRNNKRVLREVTSCKVDKNGKIKYP